MTVFLHLLFQCVFSVVIHVPFQWHLHLVFPLFPPLQISNFNFPLCECVRGFPNLFLVNCERPKSSSVSSLFRISNQISFYHCDRKQLENNFFNYMLVFILLNNEDLVHWSYSDHNSNEVQTHFAVGAYVRVLIAWWQYDFFTGFESWHTEIRTACAAKCISEITLKHQTIFIQFIQRTNVITIFAY